MSRDKAETIAYAKRTIRTIMTECQGNSLCDLCESWGITIDEFEEFLDNEIKESGAK